MRQVSGTSIRCPNCGETFELAVSDGFETKAVAPAAMETKVLPLAFTVKAVDRKQRIIEGYASTPDLDQGGDIVEPNACKFADPSDVGVYIGHDWRLGALPTGVPLEIRQDEKGLFTKTRIYDTARGDELLTVAEERLAIGKPLGQSIGYPTDSVKAKFERKDGRIVRRISELHLGEYSFTPIPMNEKALTTGVKVRGVGMKAADMSLSERQAEVREAISAFVQARAAEAGTMPFDPCCYVYVVDVYDAYVIVSDGDDYWQMPYTIGADGEATLGEQIEVDRVWVPKTGADSEQAKSLVVFAVKAGRVLSGTNQEHLQEIHDRAHAMAKGSGHDLHAAADDDAKDDLGILGGLLELELAVATTNREGVN